VAGILASGAINVDETGWFLRGEQRRLWRATTSDAAVFRIAHQVGCSTEVPAVSRQSSTAIGRRWPA
jgi:hypothetical protein